MKANKFFGVFLLLCCTMGFVSCSNDDEQENISIGSPVGETFESLILSVTFESSDSVSFHSKENPEFKGKAKYLFDRGEITILNPYGRRLPLEEVTDAYFVEFKGEMISPDIIDHVKYNFIGPQGREIHCANSDILWLKK